LKILFVLGRYLPDKNGGVENYCHTLAQLLLQHDQEVQIAILESPQKEDYYYQGIKVILLSNGINSFIVLVNNRHYDICHFHEYSAYGGIELPWFKEGKKYCTKVYFTFHLPYFTCYKNDFRYKGITDCNQFNSTERCLECVISTKLKYRQNKSSGNLYNVAVDVAARVSSKTILTSRLKERIRNNQHLLEQVLSVCDKIFFIAGWFKEILLTNGYNSSKFSLLPPLPIYSGIARPLFTSGVKRKILFVGRIQYVKGLHLLCKAMNNISDKNVILDVYGNIVDQNYFEKCMNNYQFNYNGILTREEVLNLFHSYDFLVLPSVFTEMHPLVIQEAMASRLPVIASAAKGNIDLIREGKNGFIFNYDDYKALASVIDKAYSLKENGWQPEFETADSHENDLKEILSYYS